MARMVEVGDVIELEIRGGFIGYFRVVECRDGDRRIVVDIEDSDTHHFVKYGVKRPIEEW